MNFLLGKLLVVGGRYTDGVGMKAEVVDVLNENNQCDDFPDNPYDVANPVWGLIKGHIPLVCGGNTATTSPVTYYDTCFVVGGDNSQLVTMAKKRTYASHIMMPEGDKVRITVYLG